MNWKNLGKAVGIVFGTVAIALAYIYLISCSIVAAAWVGGIVICLAAVCGIYKNLEE